MKHGSGTPQASAANNGEAKRTESIVSGEETRREDIRCGAGEGVGKDNVDIGTRVQDADKGDHVQLIGLRQS